MKTTTKILATIVISTMVIPVFNSCKKGESDPFLSLRSRKARVVGEWTIDKWKEESNYSSSSSYSPSGDTYSSSGNDKMEINGTSITMSSSYTNTYTFPPSPPSTSTGTYSGQGSVTIAFTFEKDGTFIRTVEYTNLIMTDVYGTPPTTSITTYNPMKIETSGTWDFLGGIGKDYKNKERIVLNILSEKSNYSYTDSDGDSGSDNTSDTYANGESSEIWHLSTLKNKEMIMDGETNNVGANSYTDVWSGNASTSSGTSSSKGTVGGTLTRK